MSENLLFYGDNLDVLRGHAQDGKPYIAAESVDLIYLDPPFNSNADYNAFFAEQDGSCAAAQIQAFKDTWRWDQAAARAFDDFVVSPDTPEAARKALLAFRDLLGTSDMLAYLAMMAPRLVALWRVLRPSGSLYLHCDPTASHYLKLLLDSIFFAENFRNEIIWKRSHAHNSAKRYGPNHDTIFFYSKSPRMTWNPVFQSHDPQYIEKHYRHIDSTGRRYKHENPTGAGLRNGVTGQPWRGIDPSAKGRHWAKTPDEMDRLDAIGGIYWSDKPGAWPYIKIYLDDTKGISAQDIWTDIDPINMMAAERLGYPTQKPVALLERILQASSNPGDTVLDPFCGCGTTIAAAQKLGRRWIGIDVTHLAITLIKSRLHDEHGEKVAKSYRVIGEPTTVRDAERLASDDPYQFQWWALGLVGARPVEQKKGADKGIDGRLYFHDGPEGEKPKQAVFSVKAGKNLNVAMVRDLGHVVDREKAQIGVLIAMHDPTGPMRQEAVGAGFYASPWGTKHPKLQVVTVGALLAGQGIDLPPSRDLRTFKKAPRSKSSGASSPLLPLGDDGDDAA